MNVGRCPLAATIVVPCQSGSVTIQPGQRIDLIQAEVDGCGQNSITAGLYGVFLGSGLDHPLYSFNFPGPGSPAGDEFTFDGCDPDSEDDPTECINNEGGSSAPCCGGMPVWRVSEPKISLWLEDEPLGYQPAAGPRVSARLAFKQREFDAGLSPKVFSVGKRWNFSWYSFVTFDPQGNTVVHFPSGRKRTFSSGTEYLSNTHLTGDTNTGFTVTSPDGSKQVYGLLVTNPPGSFVKAYLTESWNQQGQKTTLYYSAVDPAAHVIRLQYVVDGDNRTNTLYYVTNTYSENLISRIVDPFGRTNSYLYHTNGFLTNVTDVAGLSTSFIYDDVGWITNMTTPYGTTSFKITDTIGTAPNGRSVLVTQPDGGHHLYLYTNGAPGISSSYSSVEIPVTTPFSNKFDTNQLDLRNSFHWAPRQYANLSTTTIAAMTANDFRLASMKHWLNSVTNTFGATMIGHTLSLQRDPSPDNGGATEGEKIWHDYAGKTNSQYEGTQFLPLLVGRVLPDGSTSFTRTDRNSFGAVMTEISTYSAGGGVSLRTNTFTYAANDIDLLAQTNALGVQIVSNTYNTAHQILTNVNALSETNIYTYNANHQVTGITRPTGLITTNIYDANGLLTNTFDFAIISASPVYYRTNTYTYTNDLVFTHTDERGLTTTNVYDNLQRLTNSSDLRGATKYFYTNLDLTKVIDKLGFTNIFVYDEMRRKIYETNALGYATIYTYCNCGSLDSIQDAAGNVTLFRYDNQARLTNVVYPDLFAMTNRYDLLGRVTNSIDSAGTSTTNWFNNQGLLVAVSNAFGQVSSSIYDALDRATNTTDANGVTTSMTYDNLDRLRTRTFPDSGVESMGYTANTAALTSYTNQIANVTRYVYDPLGRKTFQTNANIEATQFSYGPASDLLSLTDGKNQVTTWNYDQYGRATNKVDAAANVIFVYAYDANNRLTSRLTPAKGTTAYAYDQLGNLTNIDYPASPDISLAYDVLSRLTNMVDSVGTNKYSYDAASQLLTEDGPWTDDTVSYTNLNRLRKGLSLLQPSGSPWTNGYAYDAARRLTNVTSPAGAFGYAYDAPRSTLHARQETFSPERREHHQ